MVGTKKNSPKDGELNGWHENNSPKGWTDGKLNGRHDLTFLKDGWQKNNSPKGWTGGELYGRHKKKLTKGWRIKWLTRK